MSSTNKTGLGLSQWILEDKPRMEDFNADNALTDQLLEERYTKAEADEKFLDRVILTVSGEASLSAVWNETTAQLNAENLDVGNTFSIGGDYTVYRQENGRYVVSLDTNKVGVQKIGGFHYGLCRRVNAEWQPVNTADEVRGIGWESNVYNGVVPRSVWDQGHRPACDPKGMVYLGNGVWVDIYQSSGNGAGGLQSAYNAAPLTGTEGLNWYDFVERALVSGKRLLTYQEFCQMAFGSPGGLDNSNVNAWTAKTNTGRQKTGYVANAVSSVGCRDAVGNVWEWLDNLTACAEHVKINGSGTFGSQEGARVGKTFTNGNGHYHATNDGVWGFDAVTPFPDGYGNIYEYNDHSLVTLLAGGGWAYGARCGARTVSMNYYLWGINPGVGTRCACGSLV